MAQKDAENKSDDIVSTEVAVKQDASFVSIERSLLSMDLINDKEKALELLKIFAKGHMAKDKSPEDLMVLYVKSRELGIGFASAADHMHIVQGKSGVDIHIIRALLLKAGCNIWWEKLKDYEPQYKYTDGTNVWIKPEGDDPDKFLPRECAYVYNKVTTDKAKADGMTAVWKDGVSPVDWITTYKFSREIAVGKGTKTIIEIGTFSWNEAVQAQLPTNKDGQYDPASNWQKYKRLMIEHRAFTFGARAIGSDLLLGMYETKELLDANNIKYIVDGEAVIVK